MRGLQHPGDTSTTTGHAHVLRLGKRYQYLRELGAGSQKTVHLVFDVLLRREVAVAEHHYSSGHRDTALNEARVVANIGHHPNIVSVYNVEVSKDRALVFYQYIEGEDLESVLQRKHILPSNRIDALMRQIGSALGYLRLKEFAHGDVKPSNIFTLPNGQFLLGDFGLARNTQDASVTFSVVGTPQYMSPELLTGGGPSPAADAYALGCVLYRCATGRVPFDGTLGEIALAHHRKSRAKSISSINAQLDFKLARAIENLLLDDGNARSTLESALAPKGPDKSTTLSARRLNNFVGREPELGSLTDYLGLLRDRIGFAVVIEGAAGIGKTRLVTNAIDQNQPECVVRCVCLPSMPPQWTLHELARQLSRRFPTVSTALGATFRASSTDVSDVGQPGSLDLTDVFEGVQAAIQRACEISELLLVFEDTHSTDELSRKGIERLCAIAPSSAFGVIATTRPMDAPPKDVFAAHRLVMKPLSDAAIRAIVAESFDGIGRLQLDRIVQISRGNPLYAKHATQLMLRNGFASNLEVEPDLRELIRAAWTDLQSTTRRFVQVGAAIGRQFDTSHVEKILEQSSDETRANLEQAVSAGILEPTDAQSNVATFSHPLIWESLAQLPADNFQRGVHLTALRLLAEDSLLSDDVKLRQSFEHAIRALPDCAIEDVEHYASNAAKQAYDAHAYIDALAIATRALRLRTSTSDATRTTAQLALIAGNSAQSAHNYPEGERWFERSADLSRLVGDVETLCEAAIGKSGRFGSPIGPDFSRHVALLEEALASDGVKPGTRLALNARFERIRWMQHGLKSRSSEILEQALALNDQRAIAYAHVCIVNTLWWETDRPDMAVSVKWLAGYLDRTGDVTARPFMLITALRLALEEGRFHDAVTHEKQLKALAVSGYLWNEWCSARAMFELLADDPASSIMYADRIVVDDPTTAMLQLLPKVHALICQRQFNSAHTLSAQVEKRFPEQSTFRAYAALTAAHLGDVNNASLRVATLRGKLGSLTRDFTWISTIATLAEYATVALDGQLAAELLPIVTSLPQRFVTQSFVLTYGPRSLLEGSLLAICGHIDQAKARLGEAESDAALLNSVALSRVARDRLSRLSSSS